MYWRLCFVLAKPLKLNCHLKSVCCFGLLAPLLTCTIYESMNRKSFSIVKEQFLSSVIMKAARKGSLHENVTVQ